MLRVLDAMPGLDGLLPEPGPRPMDLLKRKDQIKFVITDHADYEWSRSFIDENKLVGNFEILFSPVHGELQPAELAKWILADNLQVRMQIQMHKYLWGDERGR